MKFRLLLHPSEPSSVFNDLTTAGAATHKGNDWEQRDGTKVKSMDLGQYDAFAQAGVPLVPRSIISFAVVLQCHSLVLEADYFTIIALWHVVLSKTASAQRTFE